MRIVPTSRLGVSTGRWGGNLGFKAREVGNVRNAAFLGVKKKFSGSQNSASGSFRGENSNLVNWLRAGFTGLHNTDNPEPTSFLSEWVPDSQGRKELEVAILRQQLVNTVSEAKGCNSCVMDHRGANSRLIDDLTGLAVDLVPEILPGEEFERIIPIRIAKAAVRQLVTHCLLLGRKRCPQSDLGAMPEAV